jgi:5-methylthioadenosine/S-adenosylhomocysteine deaminase
LIVIGDSQLVQAEAKKRGIESKDLRGKIVFPGLINTHTHIYQNLLKGLGNDCDLENWWMKVIGPAGVNLEEKHVIAAAAGFAIEAIRSGTTTVVDYMQVNPIPWLSDAEIQTLNTIGLRLVYSRGYRNTGADVGFPVELIEFTDDVFMDVLRLKKKYETDESKMIKIWLAPAGAWALTLQGLEETSEFALSQDIPITMHMYETPTDEAICQKRYNCSALQYFEKSGLLQNKLLAVHAVKIGHSEIQAFKDFEVAISHNPISNMYLASGVAPVPQMIDEGLAVSLATDGSASNNCNDMLEVLKVTALLHKVHWNNPLAMDAIKVLEMATVDAAKCIGLETEIGSLEAGKRADFFVLNPYKCGRTCPVHDPIASLVYSSGNRGVERVVIDGKTVLEKDGFVALDEEHILFRQQVMADDLFRKAGYSINAKKWQASS